MALIKCTECGTEVSDKADKCPKCACPISTVNNKKTQVIEQTDKKLKMQMLISVLVLIVGVMTLILGKGSVGGVLILIGIILIIATKSSIWWHHK